MGSEVLEQRGSEPEPGLGLCDSDGAPDSWELADLEESMRKLLASSTAVPEAVADGTYRDAPSKIAPPLSADFETWTSSSEVEEIDSFLKEALQSKDRLTILRLEQEVIKFIRNPRLQQLEFLPMPSSYLRLAAHRVAQHYNLQSSVLDLNAPEGVRIIAKKTAESRIPRVRLADISAVIEPEERQVEIKRRPYKGAKVSGELDGSGDLSSRLNQHKSVEERKEEYNKARARIFCSSDLAGTGFEDENLFRESVQNVEVFTSGTARLEKKLEPSEIVARMELNDGLGKALNVKGEREIAARNKGNSSRVAIFRDREKDRRDPDYDRSYDRYMQRFDPGFGVNLGPFGMQAIYSPVLNYNTEFPQLGAPTRPQLCVEPPLAGPSRPLRGPWAGSSNSLGYGHLDPMIGHFNPGHMGQHSGAGVYLQLPQFRCPSPAMTYLHPQEPLQQSVSQPHLQSTGSFSQARRR